MTINNLSITKAMQEAMQRHRADMIQYYRAKGNEEKATEIQNYPDEVIFGDMLFKYLDTSKI